MSIDFYVYAYFRLDGSPCYIGKGCGNRWLAHEWKGRCSNRRLAKIIRDAGGELPKVKIREGLSDSEARSIEMTLIAAIGRGRNGPLVNMTDGGEGVAGIPMASEIKAKISAANIGKKYTIEQRANMSRARKAYFARLAAAGIKVTLSDEHKAAIGRGNKGKIMSPESRAKMSAAKKGLPCPPARRERLRAYSRNKTPAHRAKLAQMCRDRNTSGVAVGLGNPDGI